MSHANMRHRRAAISAGPAIVWLLLGVGMFWFGWGRVEAQSASTPTIGVTGAGNGGRFTISTGGGAPTPQFLMMFSYFAALRPDPDTTPAQYFGTDSPAVMGRLEQHFQLLKQKGFDGVRVFPNWWWNTSGGGCTADPLPVIRANGSIDPVAAGRLQRVLDLAGRQGLVVDVSWAMETVAGLTWNNYLLGLLRATSLMKNQFPQAMFDIQNEYNVGNGHPCKPIAQSPAELAFAITNLKNAAVCITDPGPATYCGDPNRLMFASSAGVPLSGAPPARSVNNDSFTASMNVVATHEARDYGSLYLSGINNYSPLGPAPFGSYPDWVVSSGPRVFQIRLDQAAQHPGWVRPVYFQEPNFYSPSSYPCTGAQCAQIALHFQEAAIGAKFYGAAAWTFHTEGFFKKNGAAGFLYGPELAFLDLAMNVKNYPNWGASY
ncbi:MAG: hypothetical protein U0Q12_12815 [Vicinamibacterales bacterium]